MDRESIYQKVAQLMVELFDIDRARITPQARFEDLELTSLDAIDLVIELQQMTGRKVNEAKLRSARTVDDIVTLVQDHLAEGGEA